MILKNFKDLIIPTELIWKNIQYKNSALKDKVNILIENKKLIHIFDENIDNFILNALNYFENLNIFIFFGLDKNNAYMQYETNFKDDYTLYGLKHMRLNSKNLLKVMYQLLFNRLIIKCKKDIINYLDIHFKYLNNTDLEYFDVSLLIIRKKQLNKKCPDNKGFDNYCLFIPQNAEELQYASSIFFCNSSLEFIELQNFDFFLTKDYDTSRKMFLKYKKWLMTHIDYINRQQFMLFSSVVLYLLGNRNMNDLDLYVHSICDDILEKTHELNNKEEYNIDMSIKNTPNYPKHWNKWLDDWASKCGAKYFEEILGNPKYHFYYLGVKVISVHCDVVRRSIRQRPKAVADLIALRKRYHYSIAIPPIPKTYNKYYSLDSISEQEIKSLISKGGIINDENREISLLIETNEEIFINTVISALNHRYKMKFTVEDIKRELGYC
jgi:hypothetical protein